MKMVRAVWLRRLRLPAPRCGGASAHRPSSRRHGVSAAALGLLLATSIAAPAPAVSPDTPLGRLPEWTAPPGPGGDDFLFAAAPEKLQSGHWRVAGLPRKYFDELLPALFERTLVLRDFRPGAAALEWIFTGERGGFTITLRQRRLQLAQRYYDSPALADPAHPARHPEKVQPETAASFTGEPRAVTVRLDARLTVTVLLNGRQAVRQQCLLDVRRHQLGWSGTEGAAVGSLLPSAIAHATVDVEPARRHQAMLGFGGITSPLAYRDLSPDGRRRWWHILAEYNLLLHREYPVGARLNAAMDNWDRLADAAPHYYGDNFPNGELSDFAYLRDLRKLGGKVLFEFWALPPWARRDWTDEKGTVHPDAADPEPWARAMLRYCRLSRRRTGAPPDIVGIQNEVAQPPEIWHRMALRLRAALDDAGFQSVKIHMRDDSRLAGGIACARQLRASAPAWQAIDFAATHEYDYQACLFDPDRFDALLSQWREAAAGKPFLSTELCLNRNEFQADGYRLALAMAQLYHKNLTLADATAILYCWLLLNVEQPSYGWTRALFVPDPAHGFVPVPSGYQTRVFGAYSRRIRAGMVRVETRASSPDLLAAAFLGERGARTLVIVNRSLQLQSVQIRWTGRPFRFLEWAGPYDENTVVAPPPELRIPPGSIATLSTEPIGGGA